MSNKEYKKMIVDAEKSARRKKLDENKAIARSEYDNYIDQDRGFYLLISLYGTKIGITKNNQLAAALGMSAQQFNRMKKSNYISKEKLLMLCKLLDIRPVDYFKACDPANY